MIKFAFKKLLEKKYIIQGIIFFLVFTFLYFTLDYLNVRELNKDNISPSTLWIISNIFLNVIMSFLATLLLNLSNAMLELRISGDKGSNLGFFSIIFGILTYGCTSCVVTFFAAIGISFIPGAIFPFIDVGFGILYKFLSLVLILIGLAVVMYNIEYARCKIPKKRKAA
ncbi:MAG TPA: hypothetical protein GX742_03605 [Acholeplasmataceae bacterium]|nr:hypothetical protein [Acholeplasmataceae bacterium]